MGRHRKHMGNDIKRGLQVLDVVRGLEERVDTELRHAAIAVKLRGQGAKATVTITLSLTSEGGDQLTIKGRCKSSLPVDETPPSIMFLTEDGEMTRKDPSQLLLEEAANEQTR